jgi:1,4-alpha-glucan branching enzyme
MAGRWIEIFNTDSQLWGGGNIGNAGEVWTNDIPSHGRYCSIDLNVPPLGAVYLKKG